MSSNCSRTFAHLSPELSCSWWEQHRVFDSITSIIIVCAQWVHPRRLFFPCTICGTDKVPSRTFQFYKSPVQNISGNISAHIFSTVKKYFRISKVLFFRLDEKLEAYLQYSSQANSILLLLNF